MHLLVYTVTSESHRIENVKLGIRVNFCNTWRFTQILKNYTRLDGNKAYASKDNTKLKMQGNVSKHRDHSQVIQKQKNRTVPGTPFITFLSRRSVILELQLIQVHLLVTRLRTGPVYLQLFIWLFCGLHILSFWILHKCCCSRQIKAIIIICVGRM